MCTRLAIGGEDCGRANAFARSMTQSANDQIEGKLHELKGKVKETAGKISNDPDLTVEGQSEQLAGKIQKKVGQIEKVLDK